MGSHGEIPLLECALSKRDDALKSEEEVVQTLTELQLDISAARISTEKGAAIDTFYVQEVGDGKILSLERQKSIGRRLKHAIHALDTV